MALEIHPIGGNNNLTSFVTRMAQILLEKQSSQLDIPTSDVRTEEFSMPVERVGGLSEILGEGKFIKPSDSGKAFQMVLNN